MDDDSGGGAPVLLGPLADASTARLGLRRPTPADAAVLHERVMSDPRTWALDPALRTGGAPETARVLRGQVQRWHRDGLGSWVLRELDGAGRPGEVVGVGGCSLPTPRAWNLAFRLRPEVWGRGYGREVAAAAVAAAHRVRPDLPVTAVVLAANAPSRRVVLGAGLAEVGRAPDARGAPPSPVCLHADRPLGAELVEALLGWRPAVAPDGAGPAAG